MGIMGSSGTAIVTHAVLLIAVASELLLLSSAAIGDPTPMYMASSDDHGLELVEWIFPKFHTHRTKRALDSSLLVDDGESQRRQHHQRLVLEYSLRGKPVTLDLTLNEDILPEEHVLVHQNEDGNDHVVQHLLQDDIEMCHYRGTVRQRPGSRVALSTCGGIVHGAIYDHDESYLIDYRNDSHAVFRTRGKREIEPMVLTTVKPPFSTAYRANTESHYIELALVVDRALFGRISSNVQRVHQYCISVVNVLNELYRPLNVYILLVGVVIWNTKDRILISQDSKQTLDSFLAYRKTELLPMLPNDNAHLLTAVHFQDSVVGKAEMGSMCSSSGSGGIGVVDTNFVALQATTIAHELGHNLNIDHDEPQCTCHGRPCIMSPKSSASSDAPSLWSSCSMQDLQLAWRQGLGACLRNKPKKLFVRAVCGNGLLEPGEECDCGSVDDCDNSCCEAALCRLTANATCATGECCDLETCQPKAAGVTCRGQAGECDLPEYCDGKAETCPKDVFVRDTKPCDGGNAFCFQGRCNTRDRQCQLLWGPTGRSADPTCYRTNLNGTIFGNCGNDLLTGSYQKCETPDMQCGLLHCSHRNEKLEYGMEAYSKLTTTKFEQYGPRGTKRSMICNAAIVDLGLDVTNPGLVPDGTKCGTGKMCYQQQCVAITHLQEHDIGDECPMNCNGHGVCNSEGNCHCEPGYAPPFCDKPGPGGSVDSGPIGTGDTNVMAIALGTLLLLLFVVVGTTVFILRKPLTTRLHMILKRFRERKYGHIIPPSSPTGTMPPAVPNKPEISEPTLIDDIPDRIAPPPPPPAAADSQHFINVNISKDGKITVENKLVASQFLHNAAVLDTKDALRMKLQERSMSTENVNEEPLVSGNVHQPVTNTPPFLEIAPDFSSIVNEIKMHKQKMHDYHNQRSKSDEKSPRLLPKLPRQHTISDFDSIEQLPYEESSPIDNTMHRKPKPLALPKPKLLAEQLSAPRQLPAVPGTITQPSGANVAALKAKLNLAQVGKAVKR